MALYGKRDKPMWPASAFTSPEPKPHSSTQSTHLEEVHTRSIIMRYYMYSDRSDFYIMGDAGHCAADRTSINKCKA